MTERQSKDRETETETQRQREQAIEEKRSTREEKGIPKKNRRKHNRRNFKERCK